MYKIRPHAVGLIRQIQKYYEVISTSNLPPKVLRQIVSHFKIIVSGLSDSSLNRSNSEEIDLLDRQLSLN